MSTAGKMVLLWVLMAKSLCWFLPFLPLWALFTRLRFWRTTAVTLIIFWIVMFYFMGLDLVSVGFAGYHLWDYLPNLEDLWRNPDMKVWQWAGGHLTAQALAIFLVVTSAGLILFFASISLTAFLTSRLGWLTSRSSVVLVSSCLVLFVVAPIPAGGCLPDRVLAALPVSENMKRVLGTGDNGLGLHLGLMNTPVIPAELLRIGHAAAASVSSLARATSELVDTSRVGKKELPKLGYPFQREALVTSDDEIRASEVLKQALDPGPVDTSAFVREKGLPNVILIIFESFRYSALGPELMKELDAWAQRGLRLNRHYSGSNCSHLGLFSLLYSRIPLGYHETLNRHVPAQLLESLRQSGYEITFLTAGETKGFRRLDEFLNKASCDNFVADSELSVNSIDDWPDSDRKKLDKVRKIINKEQGGPKFVFFYLISSHYRYAYPPEFAFYKGASNFWDALDPTKQIQKHINRYANSCLFLEHEVLELARTIDPDRNIIIITGDHGESMGEDGVFTHGSRMSEIQMRVPFVMVGRDVVPRKINTVTVHYDLLPTLLHILCGKPISIKYTHGRDLVEELSPKDEVFVVPSNGPDWDRIMMIRGDLRLLFRPISTHGNKRDAVMKFEGMVDELGDYTLKVSMDRSCRP